MTPKTTYSSESDPRRLIGLSAGLAVFVLHVILPTPIGLTDTAWSVAALTTLMAIWWMTEAVPLAATALAPMVLLPILGVKPLDAVAQSYAHPLVLLFFGGFLIAKALERWNLHARVAVTIMRLAPRNAAGIVGAIMAATAFLSMWISNTAAALIMASIAQSISRRARSKQKNVKGQSCDSVQNFSAALMLGVAFAATIGGMATLIGTPPNALLAGYLQTAHGVNIGFGQWMGLGVPVMIVLLPVTWGLLTRLVFDLRGLDSKVFGCITADDPQHTQPLSVGAMMVAGIVLLTAAALVSRPLIEAALPEIAISDAGIVMTAAMILFVVPAPDKHFEGLLRWQDAETIRWDVLILFGGGLALAGAIDETGLARSIGSLFSVLEFLPFAIVVLIAMAIIVYLGELASNTAMAAVFLPIAGAAAIGLGVSPVELVIPVGLAASLGFMLPVATPPNAIVYGTGEVSSGQMLKAGALLDVVAIFIVYLIATLLGPVVIGR